MTGKQHTAQNVGGPVITITTIRHSLLWHTLSSRTVKPLIFFSIFLFPFLFVSCSHSIVTPEDKPVLSVEPDEATCTQVWVKLKVSSPVSGYKYRLYRNGSMLGYFTTPPADTVIIDEPLTPNYRCEYELIAEKDGTSPISSGKRVISTLDTTSHNFSVQSYEFGDYDNSLFRYVTITDDNNIWVAGEVYKTDSTGVHNSIPYNLFHWNGNTWEWKKLYYSNFCNSTPGEHPTPGTAIFGVSSNKLLFAGYNRVSFFDGVRQSAKQCVDIDIFGLWGNGTGEFYGVGYLGGILKYKNNSWQPMQSGTSINLHDVWGDTLSGEIWTTGYTGDHGRTVLLHYYKGAWHNVFEGSALDYNNNIPITNFWGVWSNSKYFIYLTNKVYILKQPNQGGLDISKVSTRSSDVIYAMRGTNHNNIFVAGQGGLIGHFNGISYREISSLTDDEINYYKIAVRGNTAVAVGQRYSGALSVKAVITVIKRN